MSKLDLDVLCGYYRLSIDSIQQTASVTAYHLTPTENVKSILVDGLTAKPCKATRYGDSRRSAVYLLASKVDTEDTNIRNFLFDDADITVLKIKIPRSAFANLRDDGLFNMSCVCNDGSYPTGMQYADNIPAEWIEIV